MTKLCRATPVLMNKIIIITIKIIMVLIIIGTIEFGVERMERIWSG